MLIGNDGITLIIKNLPPSIQEIGLVDCDIIDFGGLEILKYMWTAPHFQIICMEQNKLSDFLK